MEIRDELTEIWYILKEPWLWIIILSLSAILLSPWIFIGVFSSIPPQFRLVAVVLITISWGIASGCKDWMLAKHKEEKKKRWT